MGFFKKLKKLSEDLNDTDKMKERIVDSVDSVVKTVSGVKDDEVPRSVFYQRKLDSEYERMEKFVAREEQWAAKLRDDAIQRANKSYEAKMLMIRKVCEEQIEIANNMYKPLIEDYKRKEASQSGFVDDSDNDADDFDDDADDFDDEDEE